MKKTKFLIGACLAFVLAGCSDDDVVKTEVTLPVSGDEVMFGASSGKLNVPQSRTIYGEPDDYEDYSELTINWQVGQDQVRVYSPQASTECQSADYTVREQTTEGTSSYYLEKNGEIGVRWGDTNTSHDFYAFYPLNVDDNTGGTIPITGLENSTVVSANIPVAQDRGNIQERENGGTTWKIIAPNMTYCMMVGRGSWTSGTDRNVPLTFRPIVLVLDVVVNAGSTTYNVTGVQVRSKNQPIVGSFNYNVANGDFEYTSPSSDSNTSAWVDCSENGQPLTLEPGQKLNVKFFLLPRNIESEELSVSVMLANGQTLTQALVPNGGDGAQLVSGQIVKVRTPAIDPAQPSNWMSMIDNDVLFASQLSLPGTKHSYTYTLYNDERSGYNANNELMQTFQMLDIDKQFEAGVRAFDVKLNGENANIYVSRQNTSMTIKDMLNSLKDKLDNVPTEFCIVAINYVSDQLSPQEWLNAVIRAIDEWSAANPRRDQGLDADGSDENNDDADYFREVISTTTVGVMRHGIGIMIHYPEANPSFSSNNVNVIPSYSTSVQNTNLVQYDIQSQRGTGHVTIQDLQQVNNPDQNRYPYFITEQYALGEVQSMDLIQKKKDLVRELFELSRTNNAGQGDNRTNNLYVNDLGGFCVVNNDQSTGWAEGQVYECSRDWLGGRYSWDRNYMYGNITDCTEFTYVFRSSSDVNVPSASAEHSGESYVVITNTENSQLGQGGNNALLAEKLNNDAANYIYNLVNEGRTPLGVVYMNFAGTDQVSFGGTTYNVSGVRLPSLIMSNNFKFALATSGSN